MTKGTQSLLNYLLEGCLIIFDDEYWATLIQNLYKMGTTAIVNGQITVVAMEYCENNRHIMRIIGTLRGIMSEIFRNRRIE